MREIKFRAWNKRNEEIYYSQTLSIFFEIVGNDIIMQFTGLKDKNGREIYEGDIVKTRGHVIKGENYEFNCIVVFEDYSWKLKGEGIYWINKPCEVIGNIYENPELLKE